MHPLTYRTEQMIRNRILIEEMKRTRSAAASRKPSSAVLELHRLPMNHAA